MAKLTALLAFLIFASILSTFQAQVKNECEYEMVVFTGTSRGPRLKLWVSLKSEQNNYINTTDLIKTWGAMGPKHVYFSPNSQDRFRIGKLPCIDSYFCNIRIGGRKGKLKPRWHIGNITVTEKGNDATRFSYLGFDTANDFATVNPPIDYGVCP